MKVLIKLFFLFTIISIIFNSCISIALKTIGADTYKAEIEKIPYKNKEIYFLGTHHIGRKEFYEDVKNKVDSFRAKGYKIYFEGINNFDSKILTKVEKERYGMKFRKILGFSIKNKNNDVYKKMPKNFIFQSNKNIGIDTIKDIQADLSLDKLIDIYEKENGEVILDKCDYETPFTAVYKCSKKSKLNFQILALDIRNNEIVSQIFKNNDDKVLIVYGKEHLKGIIQRLDLLK